MHDVVTHSAEARRPARGAGKRGKAVETLKDEVFLELISRCLNSKSCKISIYDFMDFAVGIGLSRATVWRMLKRLQRKGKIGRPKKSIICCKPLLDALKVSRECDC